MLKKLSVKNFALIKDIEVDFDLKFTSITGQTGAGKSILLDALFLLFGKRSEKHMIRLGFEEAIVEGVFLIHENIASENEIAREITIRRKIDRHAKNEITLNDQSISLMMLKKIMDKVGIIQTQNDLFKLLDESKYVSFIDVLDPEIAYLKQQYLTKLSFYQDSQKELNQLMSDQKKAFEFNDLLLYQLNEIRSLALQIDEKKELQIEFDKLKNFDQIYQTFHEAKALFESGVLDELANLEYNLSKIAYIDQEYLKYSDVIKESYYNIEDVKSDIYRAIEMLDFDQNRFDYILQRMVEIEKLEKKYHKEGNELLKHLNDLEKEYEKFNDYDGYIIKQQLILNQLKQETYNRGIAISKKRNKAAKLLQKELVSILKNLSLEHTKFEIVMTQKPLENVVFKDDGIDEVEFLVSFNEGEIPLAFTKVASGGERARFMYALRSVEAVFNEYSMIVFDEVDTGISGRVAGQMASHMKDLSEKMQLITITHLPQVAAKSAFQLQISKEKKANRMETTVLPLDFESRVSVIASMLSDEEVSPYAIEQAKALLKK